MTPRGSKYLKVILCMTKKGRSPFSMELGWVSAIALGSCCPWRVQQTLCREGRDMRKREQQPHFRDLSNPCCCHLQKSIPDRLLPSPSPDCGGLLPLPCFLLPNRLSQFQQFPFSSPSSSTFCCSPPKASSLWSREGRDIHQRHNSMCASHLQGWLDFPDLPAPLLLGTADTIFF